MRPAVLKILTFSFLFISAVSCKKSDTATIVPPKSKTILLIQSAWKIQTVAIDMDKNGVPESDATGLINACKLDNSYTFKTDGSGTMDEGATKCAGTDPQTVAFTWAFKSTETILSGNFSFTNGDASIVSMNDTSLVVTYDDNFGTSTSYHIIATLKH